MINSKSICLPKYSSKLLLNSFISNQCFHYILTSTLFPISSRYFSFKPLVKNHPERIRYMRVVQIYNEDKYLLHLSKKQRIKIYLFTNRYNILLIGIVVLFVYYANPFIAKFIGSLEIFAKKKKLDWIKRKHPDTMYYPSALNLENSNLHLFSDDSVNKLSNHFLENDEVFKDGYSSDILLESLQLISKPQIQKLVQDSDSISTQNSIKISLSPGKILSMKEYLEILEDIWQQQSNQNQQISEAQFVRNYLNNAQKYISKIIQKN